MTHLDDYEFADAVAGLEPGPETAEHLSACVSCRQQVAALQRAIADRRQEMEAESPDWDRQLEEIVVRLPIAPVGRTFATRQWLRPLLAAAAVLLVAVGLRFLWVPSSPADLSPDPELQIEQILAEVDAVLADESLPGFESIDPGVDDPASYFENGTS